MENINRESYVESQLAKWRESYIVKPEQEFMLKAMFELQYQYKNTPDDHIKTKRDLIEAVQRIMSSLKLVPALSKDRFKVLVIVNDDIDQVKVYEMFQKMFVDRIPLKEIQVIGSGRIQIPLINTNEFEITIKKLNMHLLRGMRADYILNLTGNKEVDDYFKGMNKL